MRFSGFLQIAVIVAAAAHVSMWTADSKAAGVDPETSWNVLETEHFEIIFDKNHSDLAREYAAHAERAYQLMTPVFNREAPEKTVLWIWDQTDLSNGSATPFPRPLITAFPVLPGILDSISYYDNWGQELVTHEYAHILNMEPSNGFLWPLRKTFGSIIRPNALLPRWYLEGLAVEMESRYTKKGRLKSPHYEASIRAMVLDGVWYRETIDRINETSIPGWPSGNRPYFYGSLIMHEATEKKGVEALGLLNDSYSRRIPFFLNGPAETLFEKDWAGFYLDMQTRFEKGARKQLERLKLVQAPPSRPLGVVGFGAHSPAVSPDGSKLLFVSINEDGENEIRLSNRKEDGTFDAVQSEVLIAAKNVGRAQWLPDGSGFLYDRIDTWKHYYLYSDAYLYDFAAKKGSRITKGFRAAEPSPSLDGKQMVFVQIGPGRTRLMTSGIDGSNPTLLYEPPLQYRISRPLFLNEKEILFGERNTAGEERLMRIPSVAGGAPEPVLKDYAPALNASLSSEGLIFISEKSGVRNVWLADKKLASARPVTNSLTQITTATQDKTSSKILFSELTGDGSRLFDQEIPKTPLTLSDPGPALVSAAWPAVEEPAAVDLTKAEQKEYSPASYLFPQYWLPLVYTIPQGIAAQVMTGGFDPLGTHGYDVSVTYDSLTNKPGYGLSYLHNRGRTSYSLINQLTQDYYYGLKINTPSSATLGQVGFPLDFIGDDWNGSAGWSYLSRELPGPTLITRSGPRIGLLFNNSEQKSTAISPESGGLFSVYHQHFLPNFGTIDYPTTDLNGRYFWSGPFPKHHVLAMSASATGSPRNRSILLGVSGGGDYNLSFYSSTHTVRGYPVGEFLGWNMASASLEYRFPWSNSYSGWGTLPFFTRRWHGAVFIDGLTTEGFYYDEEVGMLRSTPLGRWFGGVGFEARSEMTVGYHLPITLRVGFHYGLESKAYGGPGIFLGLILPRF